MKRILLLIILLHFIAIKSHSQSFNVADLVNLSTQPVKNVNHFMNKKGFILSEETTGKDTVSSYIKKMKPGKKDTGIIRSIDIYDENGSIYFTLHTSSLNEYVGGERSLIKSGFFYDGKKIIGKDSSILFQKGSVCIQAISGIADSAIQYSFKLRNRSIPDSIVYAEDLLQFDSHEFLCSYFGAQNVKKDMYYFSEKELKRCSVLYSGTRRQALFVWGDENNFDELEYIIVTNVLPTKEGIKNNPLTGDNIWKFKNGIHAGMPIRDLLRINEMDFYIYGNKSELAYMTLPEITGKINFQKTEIMLGCNNCVDEDLLNQKEVSALDVAKANLPMHINDIIIYPASHK